jgi:phenylalanine-4-hydroxylase
VVEPDVFHDPFGHVPLLFNRCLPTTCRPMGGPRVWRVLAPASNWRLYW